VPRLQWQAPWPRSSHLFCEARADFSRQSWGPLFTYRTAKLCRASCFDYSHCSLRYCKVHGQTPPSVTVQIGDNGCLESRPAAQNAIGWQRTMQCFPEDIRYRKSNRYQNEVQLATCRGESIAFQRSETIAALLTVLCLLAPYACLRRMRSWLCFVVFEGKNQSSG
jgi:hypothetical protein